MLKFLILLSLCFSSVSFVTVARLESNDKVSDNRPAPESGLSALTVTRGSSTLLDLGTQHTMDPSNKQIAEIRRLFAQFQPTVVLIEGGDRIAEASEVTAIKRAAKWDW
jgi:hypothetical protein